MSRLRTAGPLAVVATVLALIISACGVPVDREPRAIELTDQLARAETLPEVSSEPTGDFPTSSTEVISLATVFLVDDANVLVGVNRTVSSGDETPLRLVEPVLAALIPGPSEQERADGLSSAIPAETRILESSVTVAGTAIINLESGGIDTQQGENLRAAVAQIVYTLTEIDGIEGVRIRIDSDDRSLATESGTSSPFEAVSRADYPSFSPDANEEVTAAATVFLIDADGELLSARRSVSSIDSTDAAIVAALSALFAGPTEAEAARGVVSTIPIDTTVVEVAVTPGRAIIGIGPGEFDDALMAYGELSPAGLAAPDAALLAAAAQIVFTATAFDGIDSVRIEVDGEPRALPVERDGFFGASREVEAVDRQSYRSLADPELLEAPAQ